MGLAVKEIEDPDEFLTQLESASFLISGRFHYTITAFALRTPFLMLSANTPKNVALSEMLDCEPPLCWDDPDLYKKIHRNFEQLNVGKSSPSYRRDERLEHLRALARRNIP